jgi:acyl-CoA reductase-like NAD-dependent aldehyde dehydrogenase
VETSFRFARWLRNLFNTGCSSMIAHVAVGREAPIRFPSKFFINGSWVMPSSNAYFDVIFPATEEVFVRVVAAQKADVSLAVAAAREAFDRGPWPRLSHCERAAFLRRISQKIAERAGDAAQIWPNEMGILHSVAKAYSPGVADVYDYYAALAETFEFEEQHKSVAANCGLLVREPVGVVGAIIPWNGPMSLIAFKSAPALLAGCTIVIKASPEAPGHALMMGEIAQEIGVPAGVVNVLTADREASEALVVHAGVDKIAFTGSTVAGRRIASLMGARIGRCTLELGGKSAAIVLDDYDVETAARELSTNACAFTGQVCAALSRIIVPKHKHDDFVDAIADNFKKVQVGDPFDPASQMGPLAMRRQRDRVEGYIASGRDAGYRIAAGGGRPSHLDRGFFIEPTVFANVDNSAVFAQEEIFGPIVPVIAAHDDEHAVQIANDSVYGLNGAIFTSDVDRAYALARQIRTGTVGHNGFKLDFGIAFGGVKQSGVGREGGVEGLRAYLESKTLLLDNLPSHLRKQD